MATDSETSGIQTTAIASLPPDMAILKLENETIQSLAAARPRDMEKMKAELTSQLLAFPALAEDAIYEKPVGKDPETGEQRVARGLSVRSAEVLAEAYGFNRVRVDVTQVDDNHVKVEATFTDYQRGRIWQDAGILSKFYKDRYGKMNRTPDDRFYNVVVKAESSRRVREVILRSVNAGLKAWFWNECERMLDERLDERTVDAILGRFNGIGVTRQQVETYIGRPQSMGWTGDDRKKLLAVWNAIKDGETTIAETFGQREQSAGQGASAATASAATNSVQATTEALVNPKKVATPTGTEMPQAAVPQPVHQPSDSPPPVTEPAETKTEPRKSQAATATQAASKPVNPASPMDTFKARLARVTTPQKVAELTKTWCAPDGPLTESERDTAYDLATARDQELRFEQARDGKTKNAKETHESPVLV